MFLIADGGSGVLFVASAPGIGRELWISDGDTSSGTHVVKDIRAGSAASSPTQLFRCGDPAYFTADDGTHGRKLRRTDGTKAGTRLVQDLTPEAQGTRFSSGPVRIADQLCFGASDGVLGVEPWSMYVDDL